RKTLRSLSPPPAPVGILQRTPELDDIAPAYDPYERRRDDWRCEYPVHQRSRSSYELRRSDAGAASRRDYADYDRDAHVREELDLDEMYRKKNYHTVGSYRDRPAPKSTTVPVQRGESRRDYRFVDTPRPYHPTRSRSSDLVIEREYRDEAEISDVSHRFYDRDGNYVYKDRKRGCDLDIRRDYDFARDAERRSLRVPTRYCRSVERRVEERLEYEEKEKRMWIPERRVVSYQPEYRGRDYNSLRYGQTDTRGAESNFASSDYRRREQREISPSPGYGRREMSAGAPLIHTILGSGATGADVRVREGRLHCQSCYSNDRVQLSKV
ncbi:hypothetical protein ANCDUO_14450, partial [Ancylostoma duodenale]